MSEASPSFLLFSSVEEVKAEESIVEEKQIEEEKIDLFDLDNIDFKQRQERRRGDRRRGFRRIDDRNLIRDKLNLKEKYNLIICTGVLMYINDSDIMRILKSFSDISPEYIYIQESISLMEGRLTLNNFESKELKTNYSAIYRTKAEYEEYYRQAGFRILKTDLLLDDETGGRKETNAQYWLLRG